MKRVTGKVITGRNGKYLGIDMFEPEFGELKAEITRVPVIDDLTGIRLFIQVANNLPTDAQGKRKGEHMRIASKALDKLEPKQDSGELVYVDLEDTAYGIIHKGIEELIPSHLVYGIHYGDIMDQLDEEKGTPDEEEAAELEAEKAEKAKQTS